MMECWNIGIMDRLIGGLLGRGRGYGASRRKGDKEKEEWN